VTRCDGGDVPLRGVGLVAARYDGGGDRYDGPGDGYRSRGGGVAGRRVGERGGMEAARDRDRLRTRYGVVLRDPGAGLPSYSWTKLDGGL